MDYMALRERPRQFLAPTSLPVAEFDELLTGFAPAWERYHRWHTLNGQRPAHQERVNAVLAGSDVKLFFLLTYLKNNSLQQHQAASFGNSQTRVSRLAGAGRTQPGTDSARGTARTALSCTGSRSLRGALFLVLYSSTCA